MEQFDREDLTDRELDAMLPEWKAPDAPARLRAAVFPRKSRWGQFWSMSIRIPLPVACALLLLACAAAWLWPRSSSPKPAPPQAAVGTMSAQAPQKSIEWRPVTELRPRVIRGGKHEN